MPAREFDYVGFTAEQLPALLSELDVELASENLDTPCRIVIAGGAAIALRVPSRVTGDVDVVSEGMPAAVRRAAERVASRHGLRPDWINDAAKLKTVAVAADPEPVFEGPRLVVESAGPRYLLAMKLVSARPVDKADCVALVKELRIDHVDELLGLIEEAVPWKPNRTVTMRYFAEEVVEEATRSRSRPRTRSRRVLGDI